MALCLVLLIGGSGADSRLSVSGTREQSSELNRHSVLVTKHQKCKSYLVAHVSWERYRIRIHGRERTENTWRVSYVHWESVSAHGQCRVRVFASASSPSLNSPRRAQTTPPRMRATSPPDPQQLLFSFIIFACNQHDSLTDSVQCRHARFHLPAADVPQWKIPLQYLRKNLTSANMLLLLRFARGEKED